MRGVRFTKAEVAALLSAAEHERLATRGSAALSRAVDKLEAATLPVKKPTYGATVPQAIEAFRGVLGARLVCPPWTAKGVLAMMSKRLTALGLTVGDCTTIAKVAAAQWQGAVRAESLVRQADKLLQESQLDLPSVQHPNKQTMPAPLELSDDDI